MGVVAGVLIGLGTVAGIWGAALAADWLGRRLRGG